MPKLLTHALAGVSALALAGVAHADPLKWAPPVLVNPVTINITQGDFQKWIDPGRDVILVWPSTKHVGHVQIAGGHNIVSIGGWNTIPASALPVNSAPNRNLEISQATGTVHIEGLLIDGSGGGEGDGINIAAPLATVQIQNVRIENIYGYQDQFHADCIQPFGGVLNLKVFNFTCYTGYQGLSVWPVPASPKGWTAYLHNINVVSTGAPIFGPHNNGGYLFWPCGDQACTNVGRITLRAVYLQPRAGQPFAATVYSTSPAATSKPASLITAYVTPIINFPGLPIDGHVIQGPPLTGDFVPPGVAGVNYVSPGYAP